MDASESKGSVVPGSAADAEARESGGVEVLDAQKCWELLSSVEVGRLAVAVAGDVDIFPLNFIIDDGSIIFRTAEGTKLVEVVLSGRVAFEADGYDAGLGLAWSVVLKGRAELLDKFEDIYRAQDLPLFPWNATPKERFVRIVPDKLTGRRFTVARGEGVDSPKV
ncbi:MAG: uncharacterized protein QG622_3440 [Actinomycetota bacterium]|nr:uncharacterized protein [Actinomycetota bacterium]